MKDKIIEILNNYVDLSVYARGGVDKKILEAIVDEIESICYPKDFVEWLIHNTMEATTYSLLVYLRIEGGYGNFDLTKEWHIDKLYEHWKNLPENLTNENN